MRTLQSIYEFDIPKPGQEISRIVLADAADFISSPVVGCTHSYYLEMADGSNVPNYYSINSYGGLTINIDGDMPLLNDEILIVIRSADDGSTNSNIYRTSSFIVVTKCGPGSSDVISPGSFEPLSQMADAQFNNLQLKDVFYSTSLQCPIDDVGLTAGTQYFELTQEVPDQYQYMFEVSLRQQYLTTPATYSYSISAHAAGGAYLIQEGEMSVTVPDCSRAEPLYIPGEFRFKIPKPGM